MLAVVTSVVLASAVATHAATYTGDSSGSNAAWVNVASGTGHEAVFGANNGAAGTVTLATDMIVGALTFNAASSGNYTLTGGSLKALAGSITVRVNANATIASPIVGAASTWGSFDVVGPGTLTRRS